MLKMKKFACVALAAALCVTAFAGCGSEVTDDAQNEATKESATYQDIFDEYSEQIICHPQFKLLIQSSANFII